MIVFHRTDAAASILANGFEDGEAHYLTSDMHRGVWVSDVPLDDNEGAVGASVLEVDIPDVILEAFEWVEEGRTYREWLVPAEVLNGFPVRSAAD